MDAEAGVMLGSHLRGAVVFEPIKFVLNVSRLHTWVMLTGDLGSSV